MASKAKKLIQSSSSSDDDYEMSDLEDKNKDLKLKAKNQANLEEEKPQVKKVSLPQKAFFTKDNSNTQ